MKRSLWRHWLIAVILITVASSAAGAQSEEHRHEDHDDVSHRLFVVAQSSPEIMYIDLLDHQVADHGFFAIGTEAAEARMSENGRFLAIMNRSQDRVQVFSSGLFLEAHGDHYDLVTVRPSLFWEYTLGRGANALNSGGSDFIVSNLDDATVSVLRSEDGIQVVFPGGGGPAALNQHYAVLTDPDMGLVDIFERHSLAKVGTLRLPGQPLQIGLVQDVVVITYDDGWSTIDLAELGSTVHQNPWEGTPGRLWLHPTTGWGYILTDQGIMGIALGSGSSESFELAKPEHWAVDQDAHYMAVVYEGGSQVRIVDVGHGGYRHSSTMELPFEGRVVTLTWAGSDLAFVTDHNELWIVARDGRVRGSLDLPFAANQILTAFIADKDRQMDHEHHSHDEHDHEHDAHEHDAHEHPSHDEHDHQ